MTEGAPAQPANDNDPPATNTTGTSRARWRAQTFIAVYALRTIIITFIALALGWTGVGVIFPKEILGWKFLGSLERKGISPSEKQALR